MKTLYASLVGPLLGLYYPMPVDDVIEARIACKTSKLTKLWCCIYTVEQMEANIKQFGGMILPDRFANLLDYDTYAVERKQLPEHPQEEPREEGEIAKIALSKFANNPDATIRTAEQRARDLLERMEIDDAQDYSAGELVELANLINENDRLKGKGIQL
jgi:hypothetical protein